MDDQVRLRRLRRLTQRQREVLALRCQKRSLEEIAEALVVAETTVKYHMGKIYEHLELDTLPQRVRPIELGQYCPLLRVLDQPGAALPEPEPPPEPREEPAQRAMVAVLEDERALLSTVRPDIVVYPSRVPEPTMQARPRVSRGMAIVLLAGVAIIAALTGALVMTLVTRPAAVEPTAVSVVVTATPTQSTPVVAQVQPTVAPPPPTPAPAVATPALPAATVLPATATAAPPTSTAVPATATRVPPTLTPQPPTPTPRPQAGDVLYEANWRNGLSGWVGSSDWKVSNGQLLNDGTARDSRIDAPFRVEVDDYAVEAEVQQPASQAGWFLLFLRGNGGGGYTMGIDRDGYKMMWLGDRILTGSNQLTQKTFNPGTGWHTYRIEATGNRLRVLIDGGVFLQATDNKYLSGEEVGLHADTAPLIVRKFRVIAL